MFEQLQQPFAFEIPATGNIFLTFFDNIPMGYRIRFKPVTLPAQIAPLDGCRDPTVNQTGVVATVVRIDIH